MIKLEKTEVVGWEAAIRGMRNPMNSWEKSDSGSGCHSHMGWGNKIVEDRFCCGEEPCGYAMNNTCCGQREFILGPNDLALMKKLRNAGTDHRKFMRMIVVYVDITAPLYWWKEFDTYKVGTVANSCSTMHKIADKEFVMDDFSWEHLMNISNCDIDLIYNPSGLLGNLLTCLNENRKRYLETNDKRYWWQMIQLLPSSYNQKRTVMMSYEVLANIYKSRKNHKLDEWSEHAIFAENEMGGTCKEYFGFCDWIKTLPYSELITGSNESEKLSGTNGAYEKEE